MKEVSRTQNIILNIVKSVGGARRDIGLLEDMYSIEDKSNRYQIIWDLGADVRLLALIVHHIVIIKLLHI